MSRLIIDFDRKKCIGNASCAALAPNQFEFRGQKASLLNGRLKSKDVYSLDIVCGDNEANDIIDAAKVCPVNAIRVFDKVKNQDIVSFNVNDSASKSVFAEYEDSKEFVVDSEGYFLIRLDRKNKNIEVAFCNEKNNVILKVIGKKPIDIYQTILNKENLPIRKDHAAYLGRELEKAYIALTYNLEYIQDDELDLNKSSQ